MFAFLSANGIAKSYRTSIFNFLKLKQRIVSSINAVGKTGQPHAKKKKNEIRPLSHTRDKN